MLNYLSNTPLGHLWDIRNGWQLSIGMSAALRTSKCVRRKGGRICWFDITAGKEPPPGAIKNPYAGTNAREDWAEAFANYIDPVYTDQHLCTQFNRTNCTLSIGPLRKQYVADQIKAIP